MSGELPTRVSSLCVLCGFLILATQGCRQAEPVPPASIVLITIDTLRADHLSPYGYFRDTSPTLDDFAREAMLFETAVTTMATTLPAHASLMTSTLTTTHGLKGNFAHLGAVLEQENGLLTLAEMLSNIGYQTAAFVGAAPLGRHTGLQRGFATYDQPIEKERRADATTDRVLEWLESRGPEPFFLWVHLWDPHAPRKAPPPYRGMFKTDDGLFEFLQDRVVPRPGRRIILGQNNAYDEEILFTDKQIERIFLALKARGDWQDISVVVTGDHGEGLGQHGYMNHGRIYNEQLYVPLLIKFPRGRGPRDVRVPTVASLIDVVPTLVAALDLPLSAADRAQFEGMDLLAGNDPRKGVFSEQTHREAVEKPGLRYSFTNKEWKYFYRTEAADELYDLIRDPHETDNVLEHHPEVARQMRGEILAILARSENDPEDRAAVELDEEVVKQLEALGYLGGPSGGGASTFQGMAAWGHEVREFRPCGSDTAFWVSDDTGELWRRYKEEVADAEPYTEVYVEILGKVGVPPSEGFGAEYSGMIRIEEVLDLGPVGSGCPDE